MLGGCVGWWSGIVAFRRRCEDFSRRLQRVHKSLTPHGPFAAGSLSGYGGLKPILPFLGGRSDAASRVVFLPSCYPPMGTYGLYHDAARHVATNAESPPGVFGRGGQLSGGRVLGGGGRATFGPPLQHSLYRDLKIEPIRAFAEDLIRGGSCV